MMGDRIDRQPTITIGLPFFNNERTLKNAVNSILLQTYADWELLLIDDGSTDTSGAIAIEIAQNDSRIRLIQDGNNKGLIYRLNQVIDLANGLFIARMDADDMMLPEKLNRQLAAFAEYPDTDIIATGAYSIDSDDRPTGFRGISPIAHRSKRDVLKYSLLIHPTILVRTRWYRLNRYDEDYIRAEDYELWCRTFECTKFHRIAEPLFIYREGKVSINNYTMSMRTLRKIFKKHGPGALTNLELTLEVYKTYGKVFLYNLFGFFNSQDLLVNRRNVSLNQTQKNEIQNQISNIKSFQS